jgi:CRP-like cAMP-binding protein
VRIDHLAAVPLFADCSKRQLRHLAASTQLRQLEVDQELVAEGESSRQAYVIVAGRAVARRGGRDLAELGPGAFVGELGLLLGQGHNATVVTTTPMEVLVLDQATLRDAIDDVPGLGWALVRTLATRFGAVDGGAEHPG